MNDKLDFNVDDFIFTIEKMASGNAISIHISDDNKNNRKWHRPQTNGISGYIKAIDKKAQHMLEEGSHPESVKLFIKHNIEQLLFSSSKKINGILNQHDESSREVRKAIWSVIRRYISKDSLLFVGEERPQAHQGKNWLVKWDKPQEKTHKRIITKKPARILGNSHQKNAISAGTYTLTEIAAGIEIAIKVTRDKSALAFFMEKFQVAVSQESTTIYFTANENAKYIDYINKKTP